ncbi:T9SS type A sorting domain-containing protein [Hymenobacter sp. BT186]|uniref:T9SS type A sorting domain-containing protein n=1 Tax=Hymenobacter telluris TaxID=2816474 RepID=A0A939J9E2_9BACT|nr:T9SS type A sorting domain-containing protein [Hymenobacter telluris]MBO0356966.1 T9SS type A sorting domain-containing protein [Hymenobacter telluris]MBW3372993.1 T9SS type A sorting domain-containing protein [Hymenobacter norwichensis]
MRTSLPLLTGLLLAATTVQAQWVTQPIGFTNPVAAPFLIKAVDATTVWTIGYDLNGDDTNQVARSTDGGITWTTGIVTGVLTADEFVSCLTAVDANTAWVGVVGNRANSRILKTTNGGQTWVRQTTPQQFGSTNSYPTAVHFFSATEGVCVGDPPVASGPLEIYRTIDGGVTWTTVANTPASTLRENAADNVYAVSGNTIWVGTLEGRVFRSTDKGATWTVAATGLVDGIQNLAFRDAQNGLASFLDQDTGTRLLERTTDGGLTWTRVTFTGNFPAWGLDNVPGTSQYISTGPDLGDGIRGTAYSRDNGQTWVTLENTLNNLFVDAVSSTAAWTGGVNPLTGAGTGMRRLTSTTLSARAAAPEQFGFQVYPNPSTDGRFTITSQHMRTSVELKIADALGRQVARRTWQGGPATPFTLDLSAYKAGVYTLEIASEAGISRQKLVVQ